MEFFWEDNEDEYEEKDITYFLDVGGKYRVATIFPHKDSALGVGQLLAQTLSMQAAVPIRLDAECVLNRRAWNEVFAHPELCSHMKAKATRARAKFQWKDLIDFCTVNRN